MKIGYINIIETYPEDPVTNFEYLNKKLEGFPEEFHFKSGDIGTLVSIDINLDNNKDFKINFPTFFPHRIFENKESLLFTVYQIGKELEPVNLIIM